MHGLRILGASAVLATVLGTAALAQETPTERAAAPHVVQKLDGLEASLDLPALAAELTGPNERRDAVVARAKQLMDSELLALGDDITRHPEVGLEETRSAKLLTGYLQKHGFAVESGVAGLPTAFVARYRKGSGKPNLGIIVEYDALRGTKGAFHGDQHSAQGPIGLAAAVALAEFIGKSGTDGAVTVYGTPSEERMPPNVKVVMFDAKVFDGADVIIRSHSSPDTTRPAAGFGTCCMNINGVRYTFGGAPAHQLEAWNGRNALTAAIELFTNIDAMRSNLRPETRIQGIIQEGGAAPNVVPDKAVADFYVRYPDEVYLAQVQDIVDNAARAAALATGTTVKIDKYGEMRDGISVGALSEVGFAYLKKYGAQDVVEEKGKPQGYDETGSVSSAIPGLGLSAKTSNSPYHTYGMEADALAPVGHQGFVVDAQAMTAVLFDFLTRPDYRATVEREFKAIQALKTEYLDALRKAYPVPQVPEPDAAAHAPGTASWD